MTQSAAAPTSTSPTPETPRRIPVWRKILYSILATTIVLLVIEGATSLVYAIKAMNAIEHTHEQQHCRYDADLGWSHLPSHVAKDLYGENRTLTTNAAGFRAKREYAAAIPEGKYRVLCLGDSFTMGYGVGDNDTFPAKMAFYEPRIETVNMGQGGYGLDQALLWYKRDGVKLETDVVLFSYVYVDFFRMPLAKFNGVFPKPVLEVKDDRILSVKNVPVPKKWGNVHLVRRMGKFSEKLALGRLMQDVLPTPQKKWFETLDEQRAIARAVFAEMARLCKERNQKLVIAYLPVRQKIAEEPTREARIGHEFCRQHGISFLDLSPAFVRLNPRELKASYRIDWHFTIKGNELAARVLLNGLRQVDPKFPR